MSKLNITAGQSMDIDVRLNEGCFCNVEKAFEDLRSLIGRRVKSISITDSFMEFEIEFEE